MVNKAFEESPMNVETITYHLTGTPLFSKIFSAVDQEKRTIPGNPNTESRLSTKKFFVTESKEEDKNIMSNQVPKLNFVMK